MALNGGLMLKHSALLLSTAALLATSSNLLVQDADMAKGKAARSRQGHAYLVPPPPAYAPSILPELRRQASHPTGTNSRVIEEADASQAESTEAAKKYIYSTNGQEPKAVRQNKYVTIWNSKS